jgi:hypothetical protein
MQRFKDFLNESATQKVYIQHLNKMKPLKFLELIHKLQSKYKGILAKDKVDITEKIDGSALRIGQDHNGKSFIESSTTASMFNVGDFTVRALSKGYDDSITKHFDKLLKEFKADKKIQDLLSKYNNGNGIKIIGEILYVPLGVDELDKIKFIRISYDKSKLGTEWTFVPFNITDFDGNVHKDAEKIKKDLYRISTGSRKYIKPSIKIDTDIDISLSISKIQNDLTKRYDNIDALLVSRKKIDKPMKDKLKEEIAKYQEEMAASILSYFKAGSLGKDFEGIVINLGDGTSIKIVTDKFKTTEFKNK